MGEQKEKEFKTVSTDIFFTKAEKLNSWSRLYISGP